MRQLTVRAENRPSPYRSRPSYCEKSNSTLPSTSLSRASKALPAFDLKPFSRLVCPFVSSVLAMLMLIFFPAIVFQIANLHPAFQPLQL